MTDQPPDLRREIALFRYSVIAEILCQPPGSAQRWALIRDKAGREHAIPGSRRRRVAITTIRDWLALYEDGGFDALHPKRRQDRGLPRGLPPAVAEFLVRLKETNRRLSVRALIRQARASGSVPATTALAPATVYRLLRHEGLMGSAEDRADGQDRRRFCYREAGALWMADCMHGPKVGSDPDDRRRRRKAYLLAVIDDATRVIPHAAFAFSESAAAFLPVLRQALLKRGVPQRLYVDNGASYRSRHLAVICASLGIHLIHARPYEPAGKGKIERFFRTCRAQLLPTLDETATATLDALNRRLGAWIEGEYHRTPHRGLDDQRTPLDQWALAASRVRPAPPDDELDTIFRFQHRRRVAKDRTVSFQGRLYEVGAELVGRRIVLLVDPAAPPGRPIPVRHEGRAAGLATLLDPHANARIRRASGPRPDDGGDASDERHGDSSPPAPPLRLSTLDRSPASQEPPPS